MGLAILLVFLAGGVLLMVLFSQQLFGVIAGPVCLLVASFMATGFLVINPNESSVLTLFGEYKGTLKRNGFYRVNPFFAKKKMLLPKW